jgi:hypothetical protein
MRSHLPRTGLLIAGGALATLVLSAGPALAGQRGQHDHGGGGQQQQHQAAPRSAPAAQVHSGPAPQASSRFVARPQSVPQSNGFRQPQGVAQQRSFSAGSRFDGRVEGRVDGRFDTRAPVVVGRAVSRPVYGSSRFVEPRYFVPQSRWFGRPVFARPYFAFRPRYTFGFGLAVGYPVAFPGGYYYSPYDYSYGYPVYGYAEPVPSYSDGYYGSSYDNNYVDTSAANYGGVTFDIQPVTAAVYIDGKYIGTVQQFSPEQPPLSLTLGRHHVEIRAAGYQTMAFDADVIAGQVTPFQGGMTPIR